MISPQLMQSAVPYSLQPASRLAYWRSEFARIEIDISRLGE